MISALSLVLVGWSLVVASVCAWAIMRSQRKPFSSSVSVARAMMIRPCTGGDAHLEEALVSTSRAQRSFPLGVRIAISTKEDLAFLPAAAATTALVRCGMDAQIIITEARGPNRKVDQIARALARESDAAEVLIIADGDVDFTNLSLDDFLSPLADPEVAATWAAPIEPFSSTIADRASAGVLDASLHSFVMLSAIDARGMVGKLMAIRSSALERIGGFAGLTRYVGEDMELARRLHAVGLVTKISPVIATSRVAGRSWSAVVERYARWLTVIRAQRPHLLPSYPLLFLAAPSISLLSAGLSLAGSSHAWVAAAIAILARGAVASAARLRSGRPLQLLQLPVTIVLADLLLTVAFVRTMLSRTTRWRGIELRANDRGTFHEDPQ